MKRCVCGFFAGVGGGCYCYLIKKEQIVVHLKILLIFF